MSYDIQALNMLDAHLVQALDSAHSALASGTQIIRDDAAATGMACAQSIGRIAGLKVARDLVAQVEDELMGRKDRKKGASAA